MSEHYLTFHLCWFQAALEAPRVLNLNSSKYFSGPYGIFLLLEVLEVLEIRVWKELT